jgi:hypothetical protein
LHFWKSVKNLYSGCKETLQSSSKTASVEDFTLFYQKSCKKVKNQPKIGWKKAKKWYFCGWKKVFING